MDRPRLFDVGPPTAAERSARRDLAARAQLELDLELELELELAAGAVAVVCDVCAGNHATADCHHGTAPALELDPVRLVVIIPCSARKLPGLYNALGALVTAGERYLGTFHTYARRHAERLGAEVLILSAAHGLIAPDQPIPDYDVAITDREQSIAYGGGRRKVVAQAAARGLNEPGTVVVSLCPTRYTDVLADAITPRNLRTPLAGAAGIGEQRGRIRRLERKDLTT